MLDLNLREMLADHCRDMHPKRLITSALTGSMIHDWATHTSDIDLIAVIDPEKGDQRPKSEYIGGLFGERLTETLVVTLEEARRIVNLMAKPNYWAIRTEDVLLMEKFASAAPLSGCTEWSLLLGPLNTADYAAKLASRQRRLAAGSFDDLCGAREKGNIDVAVDCCRAMLRNEIEALMCMIGDTNGRSKWLSLRLQQSNLLPNQLRRAHRGFHFMFDLHDEDGLATWLDSALAHHHVLQANFYQLAENCYLQLPGHLADAYAVNGPLFIWRLDGSWYVKSPAGAVSLAPELARVLLAFMAPTRMEETDVSPEIRGAVDALCESGFLTQ